DRRFSREELDALTPFSSLTMPTLTAAQQLGVARHHAQKFGRPSVLTASRPGSRQDRIRIGYLSADLHDNAFSWLALPVFEYHDRSRFEVFAYDYSLETSDELRPRIESAFDSVVPLQGLSDVAAARRIADDSCDVVVDCTGWTQRSRGQILRF